MITKSKLTSSEIDQVVNFIHSTPNIIFYSTQELTELKSYKFCIDSRMVGFCLVKKIGWSGNWSEVAILGVEPEYQGQGIGSQLFQKVLDDLLADQKKIYITSANPKVQKMITDEDFKILSNPLQLPVEIVWDNLLYVCNLGRIKEFFRKRKVFGYRKFVYGVLTK